jgi:hypothetical protein
LRSEVGFLQRGLSVPPKKKESERKCMLTECAMDSVQNSRQVDVDNLGVRHL